MKVWGWANMMCVHVGHCALCIVRHTNKTHNGTDETKIHFLISIVRFGTLYSFQKRLNNILFHLFSFSDLWNFTTAESWWQSWATIVRLNTIVLYMRVCTCMYHERGRAIEILGWTILWRKSCANKLYGWLFVVSIVFSLCHPIRATKICITCRC